MNFLGGVWLTVKLALFANLCSSVILPRIEADAMAAAWIITILGLWFVVGFKTPVRWLRSEPLVAARRKAIYRG